MRGRRVIYSATEMQWLESHRSMVISDYHRAFVETFGRSDITAAHLHGLRKRKGWKVGRKPGRYVGRHRKYSDDELSWLKERASLPIGDYYLAFTAAFDRPDITPAKLQALRKRMGWKTGRTGHFQTGHVPWTKGKSLPFNANSARTRFKKGQLPLNYRGPGHRSIGAEGYVWIVLDQANPWTGASTWRVHEHRWRWEQANGPVPEGMALKCLDGNKLNTDPSNWECVPRGLLPRLNGKSGRAYDTAPAELKPAIMAVAKLEHRVREKRGGDH